MKLDDKIIGVAEFWADKMPMMVMEEMGELIQAISKFERGDTEDPLDDVAKEMADVLISIGALMHHYGIPLCYVEDVIKSKLEKEY